MKKKYEIQNKIEKNYNKKKLNKIMVGWDVSWVFGNEVVYFFKRLNLYFT